MPLSSGRPSPNSSVSELLGEQVLHRLRSAQGVLHLAGSYGAERLELACALALHVGDPSYRTVKGIPKAGREQLTAEQSLRVSALVSRASTQSES